MERVIFFIFLNFLAEDAYLVFSFDTGTTTKTTRYYVRRLQLNQMELMNTLFGQYETLNGGKLFIHYKSIPDMVLQAAHRVSIHSPVALHPQRVGDHKQ